MAIGKKPALGGPDPAEFYLPDSLSALDVVRGRLRDTYIKREKEFEILKGELPPGVNPIHTKAYWNLLVAHRRWQHAYEKYKRLARGRVKNQSPQ